MNQDLSVIILTGNEELHIERCLDNVSKIATEVFVVDSFSSDRTEEICKSRNVQFFQHVWENNYAKQFNWALTNLPIKTKWVLRLDADEYLMDDLIEEIEQKLATLPDDVTGVVTKRRHMFLDKWVKRGVYPVKLMRIFQYKKAVCEQRLMDEHIQLLEGRSIEFEKDFVDHNLHDLAWWTDKHNGYALREALDMLDVEFGLLGNAKSDESKVLGVQAEQKRLKKHKYVRLPLFWRSALYFFVRYFLKGGFLDGKSGFLWHFLQGWWYRTLVDAKIYEIRKECGNDVEMIKKYLSDRYGIDCNLANPFDKK